MNVLEEVNRIFLDVLDIENISLNRTTTAKDVDDWDSLNHMQLIVAIEKYFKIRFKASEIQGFRNVGEMCDAIESKIN